MERRERDVRVEEGVVLDALLGLPDEPGARGGVVVCHPHPLMGGTMRHPMLEAVERAAVGAGLACLRFDLRGVGASTGAWDGGVGERRDVAAAVALLRDELDGAPVVLGGWSFGAAVSLPVAREADVTGWFGIALPLGRDDLGVPVVTPEELAAVSPRLLVHGERDDVAPLAPVAELAAASATQLVTMGADHFFLGQHDRVAERVVAFAAAAVDGHEADA